MTVRELINKLRNCDQSAIVYVPLNEDGKNGTAQCVARFQHTEISIPGIAVSDDVAILPGEMMARFIGSPSDEQEQHRD